MALLKPFAVNGDREPISVNPNTSGIMNYTEGFGVLYEQPVKAVIDEQGNIIKTGGLQIKRTQFNQLMYDTTKAIIDLQNQNIQGVKFFNANLNNPASPATTRIVTFGEGGDYPNFITALNYATQLRSKWACSKIVLRAKRNHILQPFNWDGNNSYCLVLSGLDWVVIDSEDRILRCNGNVLIQNISTQKAKLTESGSTRNALVFFDDLQIMNTNNVIKGVNFINCHFEYGGALNLLGFSLNVQRCNWYFSSITIDLNNISSSVRALGVQSSTFISGNLTLKNINLNVNNLQVAYYNISHVSVNNLTLDNIQSARAELFLINNSLCYQEFKAFLNMQRLTAINKLYEINIGSTLSARLADKNAWDTATNNKIFVNQSPNTLTNRGLFLYVS